MINSRDTSVLSSIGDEATCEEVSWSSDRPQHHRCIQSFLGGKKAAEKNLRAEDGEYESLFDWGCDEEMHSAMSACQLGRSMNLFVVWSHTSAPSNKDAGEDARDSLWRYDFWLCGNQQL
ncbi:unnamed protein product [Pleuronectes platessa]|uniref:Uncharacterized protein n=1 Tax=Pleuronectes platessa TaxID=8262 RepID=A0A9N7ZDV0_PLEPL|nr:unnamed protein product [Pleuronectes platessa]